MVRAWRRYELSLPFQWQLVKLTDGVFCCYCRMLTDIVELIELLLNEHGEYSFSSSRRYTAAASAASPTCYYGSTHSHTGYCRRRHRDSRYVLIAHQGGRSVDRSATIYIDVARRRIGHPPQHNRPPPPTDGRNTSIAHARRNRKRSVDRRSRKLMSATDSNEGTHECRADGRT